MKLILATSNFHKAYEIKAVLGSGIEVLTLKDIGFTGSITENGKTFEENARIKVIQLANFLRSKSKTKKKFPSILLADDSGLEVDALKGAPGVFSARYAGEPSNDEANIQKLIRELEGIPGSKRIARFRCVLAAIALNHKSKTIAKIITFEGVCPGKIGFKPKGENGFGYDPIFFSEGFCRTFAQLSSEEKNQVSHRARAMAQFKEWLKREVEK